MDISTKALFVVFFSYEKLKKDSIYPRSTVLKANFFKASGYIPIVGTISHLAMLILGTIDFFVKGRKNKTALAFCSLRTALTCCPGLLLIIDLIVTRLVWTKKIKFRV